MRSWRRTRRRRCRMAGGRDDGETDVEKRGAREANRPRTINESTRERATIVDDDHRSTTTGRRKPQDPYNQPGQGFYAFFVRRAGLQDFEPGQRSGSCSSVCVRNVSGTPDGERKRRHSPMGGKAKPTKHTAAELKKRAADALTNKASARDGRSLFLGSLSAAALPRAELRSRTPLQGGGAAGLADRKGGAAGHAKFKCHVCGQTAPDLKASRLRVSS